MVCDSCRCSGRTSGNGGGVTCTYIGTVGEHQSQPSYRWINYLVLPKPVPGIAVRHLTDAKTSERMY